MAKPRSPYEYPAGPPGALPIDVVVTTDFDEAAYGLRALGRGPMTPDEARARAALSRKLFDIEAPAPRLARYELRGVLGRGGLGEVYLARDPKLKRDVAIKVLHTSGAPDQSQLSRIAREAQTIAALSHPHIVPVFAVEPGDPEDPLAQPFIVMEYIQGQTLRQWCAEHRSWREVVEQYTPAARALATVHRKGIVHRDFKPDNVLIGKDGRVRVADFGLATRVAGFEPTGAGSGSEPPSLRDSSSGSLAGTPAYMAPEQLRRERVSPRTDQFGFFAAVYDGLFGDTPFAGASVPELLRAIEDGRMRPTPWGDVPRWLATLIKRGLSADPHSRWPSMDDVVASLEAGSRGRPKLRSWLWLAAGVVVVAAWVTWAAPGRAAGCEGPSPITEDWNAQRRAELAGFLSATEHPNASASWAKIDRVVDSTTSTWTVAYADACGWTDLAAKDEAMGCLRRQRQAVTAALRALEHVESANLERAVGLALELPEPQTCLVGSETAPNKAGEAGHAKLAEAHALRSLGKLEEARELATQLLRETHKKSAPRLHAEVCVLLGRLERSSGREAEARELIEQAIFDAEAAGFDDVALDAWLAAAVLWRRAGEYDRVRDGAPHAEAMIARSGSDPHETARLQTTLGNNALSAGNYGEGRRHCERAVQLEREREQRHPFHMAAPLDCLASALVAMREEEAGADVHREVLQLAIDAFGADHARTGNHHLNLGASLMMAGRLDQAQREFETARRIYEATWSENARSRADVLQNLGIALYYQWKFQDAANVNREALTLYLGVSAEFSPDVSRARVSLGQTLVRLGEYAEAEEQLRWGVRIRETLHGQGFLLALPLGLLASAVLGQGRVQESIVLARQAIEHAHGHPEHAHTAKFALARALLETSDDNRGTAIELATEVADDLRRREDVFADVELQPVEDWLAKTR